MTGRAPEFPPHPWVGAGAAPDAPAARRRRLRRPAQHAIALNVTAMIDVVFLLMTYFLLIAQFRSREETLPLALPDRLEGPAAPSASAPQRSPSSDPFQLPRTPIVISVRSTGDGRAQLQLAADSPLIGPLAGPADLLAKARARRAEIASDQPFVIRAPRGTRWEHALAAFNALRRAGFTTIRFANPTP